MAFTYCSNCGEKIDTNETRCPHCGYIISHSGSYTYGQEEYNENRQGDSYNQRGQEFNNPNGQSFNPNGQGFNPNPLYRVPMRPQKRPISVGVAVFSIFNIVFGCCTLPSFVFGIIALIVTIQAQSARTEAEETTKKKIALILNIVGFVLSVIAIISFGAMFYNALMQELAAAGAAGAV